MNFSHSGKSGNQHVCGVLVCLCVRRSLVLLALGASLRCVAQTQAYSEPELALDLAVEASAAGPALVISIIQPDWIERGDQVGIGLRMSEPFTQSKLTYTTPSDLFGAQQMMFVADYSLRHPAYNVETSPKYRSGQLGVNWFYPFEHDWIGAGWVANWGVRQESSSISSSDPATQAFYASYATRATYFVPNAGLVRRQRAGAHFLAPGTEDVIGVEVSLNGDPQRYWKGEYRREQFWELGQDLTLQGRFSYGVSKAFGVGNYPLGKRFVSSNEVRGYEVGTIGPTDPGGNPIGGLRKATAGAEAYLRTFSLFDEPVYTSLFADMARIDRSDIGTDSGRTYVGYGMGLLWNAPSGAIKLNFAFPANALPSDRKQKFTFEFKAFLR